MVVKEFGWQTLVLADAVELAFVRVVLGLTHPSGLDLNVDEVALGPAKESLFHMYRHGLSVANLH